MLKVASCHEPLAPRAGNFTTQPRNYTGVRAGGERGAAGPLYQNDVRCSTFDMEMIFHCHVNNKTHFHEKG